MGGGEILCMKHHLEAIRKYFGSSSDGGEHAPLRGDSQTEAQKALGGEEGHAAKENLVTCKICGGQFYL